MRAANIFADVFVPYLDPGMTGHIQPDVVYNAGAHRVHHARRERVPDTCSD